jgi:hypothetical protein
VATFAKRLANVNHGSDERRPESIVTGDSAIQANSDRPAIHTWRRGDVDREIKVRTWTPAL